MNPYARVIEITNPFDPWESMRVNDITEPVPGLVISEWLRRRFGQEFVEFPRATLCYHNGIPLMRAEWTKTEIREGDLVQFITLPGEVVSIVLAIVAIVVAVVAVVMMPTPTTPGGQPQPDPVYTRNGQYNRSRPGEPIEIPYGYCRLWPSYGGRSYTLFQDNNQFQFNILCLGQGYYEIDKIQIEDTDITSFEEVEYQIVEPGEELTLFRNNVVTSPEVSGIEMFGPNEDDYPESGWIGPFTLNGPGTECDRIEFDTVCPNGLYSLSKKGKMRYADVTFEFQRREIDDFGNPIGDWITHGTPTLEMSSTTPQRRTWGLDVPPGRYEVRGRRLSDRSFSVRVNHIIHWQAVRGFLKNVTNYGDVTMLAVKIRATNNINDNSRSLINVLATRKLPWYDDEAEVWRDNPEDLRPTRNPIYAFCDVFRANYGGRTLGKFLHIPLLMEMRDQADADEEYFDWIFDQKITLLEAAKVISRRIRGVPGIISNRMSIIQDLPASVPAAIFTPDNIVAGSLRREFRFYDYERNDCVDIEYLDTTTWEKQVIRCVLPEQTQYNPRKVEFSGCTDRDRAYREGMYLAAQDLWMREQVVFQTGREALIPHFGSLISVSHDLIRVGTSGLILGIDNVTLPGKSVLYLSDAVKFGWPDLEIPEVPDNRDRVIVIRERNGDTFGPVVVTPGDAQQYIPSGQVYSAFNEECGWFYEPVPIGTILRFDHGSEPILVRVTSVDPRLVTFDDFSTVQVWSVQGETVPPGPPILFPGLPDGGPRPDPMPDEPVEVFTPSGVPNDDFTVIADPAIDLERFPIGGTRELPIFQFGVADRYAKLYKISNIKPSAGETIEITAVNYDPRVYSFDDLEAPPLDMPAIPPPIPALPVVGGLVVAMDPADPTVVTVAWNPAYGAQNYVLEASYDEGDSWENKANTFLTSALVSVVPGPIWFRVAAVNLGQGPWATWEGVVGTPLSAPTPPTGLTQVGDWVLDLTVAWDEKVFQSGDGGFDLELYDDTTDTLLRTTEYAPEELEAVYTRAMALADGASRSLRIELTAGNLAGDSAPTILHVTNPLPNAPSDLAHGSPSGNVYPVGWNHDLPADFDRFRVYADTSPGFTPGPGNLVYEGTNLNTTITAGVTTYWVVSASDVWGTEQVFSEEAVITV